MNLGLVQGGVLDSKASFKTGSTVLGNILQSVCTILAYINYRYGSGSSLIPRPPSSGCEQVPTQMRGPGDEASLPVSDSVCRPEGLPAHLVSFTLALLAFLLSFLLLLAFALLALLTLLALTPLHRTHTP